MTTAVQDCEQARIDGLIGVLRDAEADFRRSYSRVLEVVAELDAEKVGAAAGFGTTAGPLPGCWPECSICPGGRPAPGLSTPSCSPRGGR